MKIGFRGTRDGMTERQKDTLRQVLAEYRPDEFHHGDFVGADAQAHGIVRAAYPAIRVVIHPPIKKAVRAFCRGDEQRPARGYLARNRDVVGTCDMLSGGAEVNGRPANVGILGGNSLCPYSAYDDAGVGSRSRRC